MQDLKGKKLLLLGATGSIYDVVVRAKERGIFTIVTDYYKNSPAKRIADKSYDVSTMDIDALVKIAKENEIDGVFTGFSDVNSKNAVLLCERLGLPFYATKEQIEITSNKLKFKKMCRTYGIPVAKEYHLDGNLLEEDFAAMQYPVIIKPADSYASKGISVCFSEEELRANVDHAFAHSSSKQVIVEQYIMGYDDICMYFTIQEGEVSLSAMTDRDLNYEQKGKAQQPNALFYPSQYIDQYYEQLHDKICNMVKGLEMKNGTMFIQAFANEKEFIIFEMGYRLCGACEYIVISEENEINNGEMYINYALTGKFDGWDVKAFDNPYFKHQYCILLSLLSPGTITKIEGLDVIKKMKEYVNMLQFYYEGDKIDESTRGSLNQTFARLFLKADTKEELLHAIKTVQETLKIYDENGKSMIIPGLDTKKYYEK